MLTEQGKAAGKNGKPWSTLDMRRALKDKLVNYKIPQEMKIVDSIPRNAMGKGMGYPVDVRDDAYADRLTSEQEEPCTAGLGLLIGGQGCICVLG